MKKKYKNVWIMKVFEFEAQVPLPIYLEKNFN